VFTKNTFKKRVQFINETITMIPKNGNDKNNCAISTKMGC
jgi:hypothetical protein